MKNLVVGFATNQTETSLQIFCRSLRSTYGVDECDIIIITNGYHTYHDDLAALGVRFESTPNTYSSKTTRATKAAERLTIYAFRQACRWGGDRHLPEFAALYPLLIEAWDHPQLSRWFAYRRVLDINRNYAQVLFADVKDVFFQAPFFSLTPTDKVTLFADASPYGESFWNDKWLVQAYGTAALERARGTLPVCIGTILASLSTAHRLLTEFTNQMARYPFGRIEQAIFNQMLMERMFQVPIEIAPNIDREVATLAGDARTHIRLDGHRICRAADGTVIPIVHMYDRWSDINLLVEQLYSSPQ